MRTLLIPAAAVAALLAVAPMTASNAASAASHSVLTKSKVGGPNVKVNDILQAGLKAGTKSTFSGSTSSGPITVTCPKVTFKDKVTKNPAKPGTAIEKLISQTFSGCSVKGEPGASKAGVKLNKLPYKTTITSKGLVQVTGTNTTLSINSVLGTIRCTYTAKTTKGSASNKSQTITFVKQAFKLASGTGSCPKTGKFSATFGPVFDASVKSHPHVFVN
jgi:hypothetical protein